MSNVKVPQWVIGTVIGLLVTAIGGIVYVVETRDMAQGCVDRMSRIENGVDQIWDRVLRAEGK